jgi:O-antigen/teichoic acid export membrane protein
MKNKLIFTFSKYVTFGLKFILALYIAKYLSPAGFAVYGFAQLVSLYISFMHFGVPLSIHAMLSTAKAEKEAEIKTYVSEGFWLMVSAGFVYCIIGSIIVIANPSLFDKFEFYKYGVLSVVIGVNLILVQYFSNVYQVYGQYIRIALNELVSILLLFSVVFLFNDNPSTLLNTILWVSALTSVINMAFFVYRAPFKLTLSFRTDVVRRLIKLGIPMLVATVGFYLITISVRSIASYKYSLHEIGLFTFALNISNSVMMGLNAISWTFYSTILANTCGDVEEAHLYVQKVNRIFNFALCVTIFVGIVFFPILFYFLPEYKEFYNGIAILLLSQIFMSASFGYNSLLVAQGKQNSMALISFVTLAFAAILSILVCALELPFVYQTMVILLSMFFYSAQQCYAGAKVCKKNFFGVLFGEVFNYKILIPVVVWLVVILSGLNFLLGIAATLLFFILSYKDIIYFFALLKSYRK